MKWVVAFTPIFTSMGQILVTILSASAAWNTYRLKARIRELGGSVTTVNTRVTLAAEKAEVAATTAAETAGILRDVHRQIDGRMSELIQKFPDAQQLEMPETRVQKQDWIGGKTEP